MADGSPAVPTAAELQGLVGHRFPGGRYRVAHWESWLLTDCTGSPPLPGGLVHPIVLFHAPILGAGTTIAEMFALARADGAAGSVGLLGYDWEYLTPIREDVEYRVEGAVVAADRRTRPSGAVDDHVAFSFELFDERSVVARATDRWSIRRVPGADTAQRAEVAGAAPVGTPIPPWEMPFVDPARMKTMAALLRDPYPVHWDRSANERLGLGGRVVNQGPLNLAYVANMLMAWAGPDAIRRLTVSFGAPVLDGDHVIAGGVVREHLGGEAHCDVWLSRAGEPVVTGTAVVSIAAPSRPA